MAAVSPTSFSVPANHLDQSRIRHNRLLLSSNRPVVMDPDFVEAWAYALGAGVCIALSGDKGLANMCLGVTNRQIEEARKVDGNEGFTINDVTPDFIRIRGIAWTEAYTGPWSGFDWGGLGRRSNGG